MQDPVMPTADALVADYRRRLLEHRQRGLVVLSGAVDWCRQQAQSLCKASAQTLWLGQGAGEGFEVIEAAAAKRYLGQERDDVVFDAWSGFDPDALAAISGTVRAGHILFLLTPPLDAWPDFDDPEHRRILVSPHETSEVGRRFVRFVGERLRRQQGILLLEQGGTPSPMPLLAARTRAAGAAEGPCRTEDQARAVEALVHVVEGHRRRPLVLVSDRGRGKSSALGLAAARLLEAGRKMIIVTAPSLASVELVFERAREVLPGCAGGRGHLQWRQGELRFMAPDELLQHPPQADLVMVDEAAALPAAILEGLLKQHARIAFATTVHGYEGTGRGFELRFKQRLDAITPEWRELRMTTPVRWSEGDPLERAIFSMLLLDAELPELVEQSGDVIDWRIEHVDREQLWRDPKRMSQLFGLLVNAHYRTRPYDLRQLLDGPNVELFLMHEDEQVIGISAAVVEGKTGEAMTQAIYEGRRRLHGHLLPQSLLAHAGAREALGYAYLRIMRIAIHPRRQRKGLGTALMDHLSSWARDRGMDFIGTSFAASTDVLPFWTQLGLQTVRIGFRKEAASGSHAVMMLEPLTLEAEAFHETLRTRFIDELPYLLAEPLQQMEPLLVPWLLQSKHPSALSEADAMAIDDFIRGWRDYETVLPELWRFVAYACSRWRSVSDGEQLDALALLIEKIWQRQEMAALADKYNLAGRRGVLDHLRQACAILSHGDG